MDALISWSLELIAALQHIHPALHVLFQGFTFLGQPQFYLLFLPALLWCVDVRMGARVGIFLLLSSQFNTALKELFQQPRPGDFDPRLQLAWFEGYGLPSGHAQLVVVFWGAIAAWARRLWLWILVAGLMFVVGFSRLFLGVHFPQDILAGWAIGGLSLILYLAAQPGLERRLAEMDLRWQIVLGAGVPLGLFVTSPGKSVAMAMGALSGASVGLALERRYVRFNAAGPLWQRALRLLVGTVAIIPLYAVVGAVSLAENSWPYLASRYLPLVGVGLWITLGAPWLFRLLHLAQRSETHLG